MSIPMTAVEVLEREFLDVRAKILELASSFDRLDRADGSVAGDMRLDLIREAMDVLQSKSSNRAEQVQLIFSLEYEAGWQKEFDIASGR